MIDTKKLAEDLDIEANFKSENRHVHKKKQLFDSKAANETLSDPKETFKV